MALYKIQGKTEKRKGIYYEFDSEDEPLGEGGMGKVYKGRCVDENMGRSRNVAIKFMYSDLPPYAIEKARREAAIQFRHDNLVEMLGFIETESKTVLGETTYHYHVVSELLEGVSLDKLFEGKLIDQQGNVVPFAEKLYRDYQQDVNHFAVEIIKNILSGLMCMHDAGYIHRDIDPTNIMITSNGHIKLIDFGIAKKINSLTSHDKHLTQAGQFVGKPEYAAPELVLGAINEQNHTTDIYAVGIMLFQLIVGHVPFEGDRADILQKQLHSPLPLKLIKHKGLRKIVEIATQKSRSKRFQSAAEFRVALDRLDTISRGGSDFGPSSKYMYALGGVAAVIALVIGVVAYVKTITPDPNESSEVTERTDAVNNSFTYESAIADLHDVNRYAEGLTKLQTLSQKGNGDATFLLSRLLFKSLLPNDYCPDSISKFQNTLSLSSDNKEAHRLLELAVKQNPQNYQALYELASDYWKAEQRTTAVVDRDGDKAKRLLDEALKYAKINNDEAYVNRCNIYLRDYDRWLQNSKE